MTRKVVTALVVVACCGWLVGGGAFVYAVYKGNQNADLQHKSLIEACKRGNAFRAEVNRQARAFVHHNDGTLEYFETILPDIDRSKPQGQHAYRATLKVIAIYQDVRHLYYTLPLVDCKKAYGDGVPPSRRGVPVAPHHE